MTKLLALHLTTPPQARIVEEYQIPSLFPPERFKEPDLDQSNGFYDFLRSSKQTIVGVRWAPFPDAEHILHQVKESSLVRVDVSGSIKLLTIWFGSASEFDNEISNDQWFWWNRIFVDEKTREIGLTFGLSGLSSAETQSIEDRLRSTNR